MFHIFRNMQKQQKRQVRNKIFIFSVLSGFISAVATLLLTPKPGKEMRHIAAEKIKDASYKIKDASSKIGEKAETVVGRALNATEGLIERAKDNLKHTHTSENTEKSEETSEKEKK